MSLAEVLHELVDAAHIAKSLTDNRRAELHQAVDDLKQLADTPEQGAEPETPAPVA